MIPRINIPVDELEREAEKYQPCKGEVIISFHVPSEPQQVVIEVHLRPITVVDVRAKQFTVCGFSSLASISDVSKHIESFCRYLPTGEWINGGHTVKPEPNALLSAYQQDNVPGQPPSKKRKRNQPQDIVKKTANAFLTKVQSGIKRLAHPKGSSLNEATSDDIFEICTVTGVIQRDLNVIIRKLTLIKNQKSASAAKDDWKLEHLIRCIRNICRDRGELSVSDDPNNALKRREMVAYRINAVVNKLVPHAGPLALIIYSALAETKYKWSEVGYVKDEKVVEDVVAGVLRQAIEVPEHCELFNPVAALSWILQEDYQRLCQELGLANFSALDTEGGNGMFKELPLGLAMERACLPNDATRLSEKGAWLLEAKNDQRQALVANGPTDGRGGGGSGVQNTLDDISWPSLENGQYHTCEMCGIAMSSHNDPRVGCLCNMPLTCGGTDILYDEEGYTMAGVIQLQSYPELPPWCTIPPANMDNIIPPVDGQLTINPALIQQF